MVRLLHNLRSQRHLFGEGVQILLAVSERALIELHYGII